LESVRNVIQTKAARKAPLLLRLAAGVSALAIAAYQIVGFRVARSINLNYFKDPTVPISAIDIAMLLVGLYLLLVAISGRWQIYRRAP
jgi:hypothetical protein